MNNTIKKTFSGFLPILLVSVVYISALSAQRERPEGTGVRPDSLLTNQKEIPDTLKMTWFTVDHIHDEHVYTDTALDFNFIHYNPLFHSQTPHLFLGTPGSSSVPLSQFRTLQDGMDFGFHQYDPYKLHLPALKWFRTNIPFADLYFSPGKSENELGTSAKFTMNIDDQWNINLDYQRLLDQGFYREQATKNSSLIIGLWHRSKNRKSNTFLSFLTNIHQENNNGGILDTSYLYNNDFRFRGNIPVIMSQSVSRHQNEKYTLQHVYDPWKKQGTDSLQGTWQLQINSLLSYEKGFFKFYDENAGNGSDSLIYNSFFSDPLGLRNYINYHRMSLAPSIRMNLAGNLALKAGVEYDFYTIGQNDQADDFKNDLKTILTADFNFKKYVDLHAGIDYHFLDFAGDLKLDLNGTFRLDPFIQVSAGQKIIIAHPAWIQKRFVLNDVTIFDNEFDKQQQNTRSLSVQIPLIGAGFTISENTFKNYIYYDREAHFVQSDGDLSYTQLTGELRLKFRGFHFDNKLHYYITDQALYDIPEYRLESSFYFKRYILKNKMELFTGLESFITDRFYLPEFQPVLGAFTTQSDFEGEWHTLVNLFISFKVQDFRFFVRTENLMYLVDNRVHFQAKHYPLDDFRAFRMGVRWQFIN